jgi:hypothetical protein
MTMHSTTTRYNMTVNDLLKLNVNEHTEKKGNLTYLSWAWAWAEALKADPNAHFQVMMFGDKCYMDINGTGMVWVTVTLFGKPMTCQLPVMDSYNKPITIEGTTTINKYGKEVVNKLDSFNVNTAIMRCMTKALALHGLGMYIYSGEDLPESDTGIIDAVVAAIKERYEAGDEPGMYGEWESIMDNEVRIRVWDTLKPDSKVRSAIKAYKEKMKEST